MYFHKCFVEALCEKGVFSIGNRACTFAALNLMHSKGKYINICHKSVANQHSIDQINDLLVLSLSLSVQMSIYSCRRYLSFGQNHFLKIIC